MVLLKIVLVLLEQRRLAHGVNSYDEFQTALASVATDRLTDCDEGATPAAANLQVAIDGSSGSTACKKGEKGS